MTQSSIDGGLSWAAPVTTSIHPRFGTWHRTAHSRSRARTDRSSSCTRWAQPRTTRSGGAGYREAPLSAEVLAATSLDGGATFGTSVEISSLSWFADTRGLRAPPLPSADVAADGRLFVAWEDCRFDPTCSRDRIVLSTSPRRTDVERADAGRPCDARRRPGRSRARGRSGHLGDSGSDSPSRTTRCRRRAPPAADCAGIDVWLTRRDDGGATWSRPERLDAQPMRLDWLPVAGGRFFGDYISDVVRRRPRGAGLLTGGDAVRGQAAAGDHGAPDRVGERPHRTSAGTPAMRRARRPRMQASRTTKEQAVNDVYRSPEFESIHTLQRRLGTTRMAEQRPYQAVLDGLSSLRCEPTRRHRRFAPRFRSASAACSAHTGRDDRPARPGRPPVDQESPNRHNRFTSGEFRGYALGVGGGLCTPPTEGGGARFARLPRGGGSSPACRSGSGATRSSRCRCRAGARSGRPRRAARPTSAICSIIRSS